jgi:Tol biopolymer transport system component
MPDGMTRARRVARRGCLGLAIAVVGVLALIGVVVVVHVFQIISEHRSAVPLPPLTLPAADGSVAANRLLFDSNRTGNYEIFSMSSGGSDVAQLTKDPKFDSWWPRPSPDRQWVIFYRTPAGSYDKHYDQTSLWMMNARGGGVTKLLPSGAYGWILQGHAEWSPDGRRLVMFGGSRLSPQIFVTDRWGRHPRQVTDRGGSNLDPSWSPDGRTIAFAGCPGRVCFPGDQEIYEVAATGGEPVRVTHDGIRDNDPYYSPDGSRIAWLSQTSSEGIAGTWNIRIAKPDGSQLRMVTDDNNINSRPEWSADGKLIYFHRLVYRAPDPHFGIWVIRPDGTGLRELTTGQPRAATYPST